MRAPRAVPSLLAATIGVAGVLAGQLGAAPAVSLAAGAKTLDAAAADGGRIAVRRSEGTTPPVRT